MCLIALGWRQHADYPLIVLANRDEFFARPTRAASWWTGDRLLAGRDDEAGGTWLGVTRNGRFAALTNFRQMIDGQRPDNSGLRSRGTIVTDYLLGASDALFLQRLANDGDDYAGFNLLFGDLTRNGGEMHYFSNRGAAQGGLTDGVYGLSNALLDVSWPKVDYITDALKDMLTGPRLDTQVLMSLLDNRQRACDDALPDTGVGIEAERLLSPPFIVSPKYGTRCSTVLLVDRNGLARFHERSFDTEGRVCADHEYSWRLGAAPERTASRAGGAP